MTPDHARQGAGQNGRTPMSEHGPFETESEASATAAVRAVYAEFDADPGPGKMLAPNRRMLGQALEAAGVEMGRFDDRIAGWLANWEPATCAVIASWVARAYEAGAKSGSERPETGSEEGNDGN